MSAPPPSTPDPTAPLLLFVDADILVRSAVAGYLRECGYAVVEAASTDEAMSVLGRADLDIDIVFADVEAPGAMDGFGLARWVRAQRPGVHVVLAGTVERAARLATDLCEEGPAVRKPYDHAALLDWIKRLRAPR
jgi:CheY-like chemotaxis protein